MYIIAIVENKKNKRGKYIYISVVYTDIMAS